jgi:Rps23 Pro-64 3,4-dihydroxylase Tpa1-like proline 4-hydroxylase
MFDINNIYKIENFLTETEINGLDHYSSHYVWDMKGSSYEDSRVFWAKDLWESDFGKCAEIEETFRTKIEDLLNINVQTERLYFNGQAHGQCGNIHSDLAGGGYDPNYNYITAVYYANKKWSPEYGGFTVIIDKRDQMHIVYPNPNSIVIFNSDLPHVGLEPTVHCKDQRVTLAHKMKILKE